MARWKRLILYSVVSLAVVAFFVLISLQYTVGIGDARNPEQQGGRCASCLESLAMSAPTEGWAVGEGYFFLRYEHGAWKWVRQPTQTLLFAVASGSQGEAWGAGLDILRYQGRSAEKVNVSIPERFLTDVSVAGPDDAWFVGQTLRHYDAGVWSSAALDSDIKPSGVAMLSVNDGWASGTRYDSEKPKNGVLLRYQNGVWTEVATIDGGLYAIAMASLSDGWAVGISSGGDGVFYHYDGTAWTQAGSAPGTLLDQVKVAPSGDAWALGHRGEYDTELNHYAGTELYHYASGVWTAVSLPSGLYIHAISTADQGDVWLLGETLSKDTDGYQHGVILHYQQGIWQTIRIPPRPPAGEWTVRLGYAWMAYLLLLIMPLALGFLFYSWRPTANALLRNGVTRAMLVWAIVFCLYTSGAIWIGLSAPEALDAIPNGVIIGSFIALMAFPLAAMFFAVSFMRTDGSFRWRRQT